MQGVQAHLASKHNLDNPCNKLTEFNFKQQAFGLIADELPNSIIKAFQNWIKKVKLDDSDNKDE